MSVSGSMCLARLIVSMFTLYEYGRRGWVWKAVITRWWEETSDTQFERAIESNTVPKKLTEGPVHYRRRLTNIMSSDARGDGLP